MPVIPPSALVFVALALWMTSLLRRKPDAQRATSSRIGGLANITPTRIEVPSSPEPLFWPEGVISSQATVFWKFRADLALPSILTAKLGGGKKWDSGWSLSTGIRVFPLHGYLQTGVPTARCNRDLSERKQRRLARKGKTAADIKCSEWVFSFEISMLGLHEWFPRCKGT